MSERRGPERAKTFLRGRIRFNGGQSSFDCLVRDLSDTGARLMISEGATLPDTFELYLAKADRWRKVESRWRRGDQIGVHFLDAAALPKAVAPSTEAHVRELEAEVSKLRRLLEELKADPGKIQTLLDRAL